MFTSTGRTSKGPRVARTCQCLLTVAGVLLFSSLLAAEEVTVEGVSLANVNVRGINENGVLGIVSYLANPKDTTMEILGKAFPYQDLQKGWKVDIAWKKPPGSGRDSLARLATKITVKCEWLEGTLMAKPTEQGALVQAIIDDKPVLLNVLFVPGLETKNMGDKKPKDLIKGVKVEMQVISGSMPPIVMTLQVPAPPTPEPSPTPTPTPIPIRLPPSAVPTLPPASAPAATQPASGPSR